MSADIRLTNGMTLSVDDHWKPYLSVYKWFPKKDGARVDACTPIRGRGPTMRGMIRLSEVSTRGSVIAHRDGYLPDSHEPNIRVVSCQQDSSNGPSQRKCNTGLSARLVDFRDIIPAYLLREPTLLALYCYLLRKSQDRPTKTLICGQTVDVAAYELWESIEEIAISLEQTAEEIDRSLNLLVDLWMIDSRRYGRTRRISLRNLSMPFSIVNQPRRGYMEDREVVGSDATTFKFREESMPNHIQQPASLWESLATNNTRGSIGLPANKELKAAGANFDIKPSDLSLSPPALDRAAGAVSSSCIVREFSTDYLKYVKTNFALKTHENACRVMKKFVEMFGDRTLTSLTLEDLENYKTARKAANLSVTTVNMDVKTLKAAFNVAADWKRIGDSPFARGRLIKVCKQKSPFLDPHEFAKLVKAIDKPWLLDVVTFAALTGLRLGEIMDLKWSNYDVPNGEITVVSSDSYRVKGGMMRTIPLSKDAKALLDQRRRMSDWIFVNDKGKKYTDDYVSKAFKEYARKIGLPEKIHFHSLRHTYCTWAANSEMSAYSLKDLAGHSSLSVTEQYIGTDRNVLRKAAEKVRLPNVADESAQDPSLK